MNREDIGRILEEYDLGRLRSARPFDVDPRRPWKIVAAAGEFAVRECFLNCSQSDLEFEHGLAAWLENRGFPVSVPVRTVGGATWCNVDDSIFAVCTLVDGERFSPGHVSQARSAGAALVKFHKVASSFPPAAGKDLPDGFRSAHDDARFLLRTRSDRKEIGQITKQFAQFDEDLCSRALATTLLFNDFRPDNVLFLAHEFAGAFDLDCCYWGPRLLDLAKSTLAFGLSIEGQRGVPASATFDLACARAFLDGYRQRGPILPEEARFFPTALRRQVRASALFDLRDVEEQSHRWIQEEWDLSRSQIDMVDAACESVIAGGCSS